MTTDKNTQRLTSVLDPLGSKLKWIQKPVTAFVAKKPGSLLIQDFVNIIHYLSSTTGIRVHIEEDDAKQVAVALGSNNGEMWQNIVQIVNRQSFTKEQELVPSIDFIVTLGGDGTLIRATSFFPKICPPVLPFNSGSLGFLNTFRSTHYKEAIEKLLSGEAPVLVRSRLKLKVRSTQDSTLVVYHARALNEIVIDRGSRAFLTNIDMFINHKFITKVQGDGLIVSTPTGSTAYAMAAGASIVHPSVDAMVVCPICPHSLSFRPIIVPQKITLTLTVSSAARNSAWLSIDGQHIGEIKPSQSIEITCSDYPVPCVCNQDQIADWFESLAQCLHWNMRTEQKSLKEE